MKLILTILFFTSYALSAQSVYHIKNGGNDALDGLTDATAWASLSKITNGTFFGGDSILLKRGSIFNDSIRVHFSGTIDQNVVIGAYGTGLKPEVTGFQSATMSSAGGNIYTGTATNSVKKQNTILVNDTLWHKARTPNAYVTSGTGSVLYVNYIAIPHSAISYVNKEIAVYSQDWQTDVTKIASQNNGASYDTLYFSSNVKYGAGITPKGYFFQNSTAYLDSAYEYTFDSTTKLISVYSQSLPVVKYSSIDTLVVINRNYLTFENITFSGSNISAVWCNSNVRSLIVKNCVIKNSGLDGIMMSGNSGVQITNDTLINLQSNAFACINDTSLIFNDNYVKNIGVNAGMGRGGFLEQNCPGYSGFFNSGNNFSIQRNSFINIGYIPIYFKGSNGTVRYNYVDSFLITNNDGGGIYTWQNGSAPLNNDTGTVVKNNIITKSSTTIPGLSGGGLCFGIYLDQYVWGVTVDSNIIEKTSYGVYLKGSYNTISNNIINPYRSGTISKGLRFEGNVNSHNSVINNIFYTPYASVNTENFSMYFNSGYNDTTATVDYNYYIKPLDTKLFYVVATFYSLSTFKTLRPLYNIHSVDTIPANTVSTSINIYNPSMVDSTVAIGTGYYMDVYGRIYFPTVRLKPFESKILFPYLLTPTMKYGNYKFR